MNRLKRLFLDEKRFWVLATVVLTPVALRRGFHKPIAWAATQAQVDYRHGFVKRGLFGELVTRPMHLEHYHRFAVVSSLLLVAFLLLLAVYAKRTSMLERCGSALPLAVLGASYTVTYLGDLNGYLDVPLGILTVGLLMVKNAARRALLGVPVIVAAVLIHEMFLVVFLPVVLLSFLLQGMFAEDVPGRRVAFAGGVSMAVLAVAVTVATALRASAPATVAATMRDEVSQRVDFKVDPLFFEVMQRSAMDNVRIMEPYWKMRAWRRGQVSSFLVWGPVAGLLLAIAWRLMQLTGKRERRWAFAACVAVTLMPLAMNGVGWDGARWYALVGLVSFLVLGTVCLYLPPGPELDGRVGFERAAVLVIALNFAANVALIQGTIRFYPFIR